MRPTLNASVLAMVFMLGAASSIAAQTFSERGFIETGVVLYPQVTNRDKARVVTEVLLRYEPSWGPMPWIRINGSFDARIDTHDQVARSWDVRWWDRTIARPALAVRRLEAVVTHEGLTVEVGKQFVRWGKADILNPTDRFAPRDYLNVTDTEFLGVTGVRMTYEKGGGTIDAIWTPRPTPSRIPLFDQRWDGQPLDSLPTAIVDDGSDVRGGSQVGIHWSYVASHYEYSLAVFDGTNYLPLIEGRLAMADGPAVELRRIYPSVRMYGGDAAVPLRWFTIKGETGYFTGQTPSESPRPDDYLLYVVQLERQVGEWSFAGGYAGQTVVIRRTTADFAPDRGLTEAFLGRAGLTIDTNRSLAVEGALRQNGDGSWLKFEYSQAAGQHVRVTAALTWIRGEPTDFFGQFDRNSHARIAVRYSF